MTYRITTTINRAEIYCYRDTLAEARKVLRRRMRDWPGCETKIEECK